MKDYLSVLLGIHQTEISVYDGAVVAVRNVLKVRNVWYRLVAGVKFVGGHSSVEVVLLFFCSVSCIEK